MHATELKKATNITAMGQAHHPIFSSPIQPFQNLQNTLGYGP